MLSQDNSVSIDTPQLATKRELLTAAIRRTDHDLGWLVTRDRPRCSSEWAWVQLSVISPDIAPLDTVFLDETQVALVIDQDGDGKIEYDEYVKWFKTEKGKYNETEKAFDAAHAQMWQEVRTRAELQNPSDHPPRAVAVALSCVEGGARPLNVTGLPPPVI